MCVILICVVEFVIGVFLVLIPADQTTDGAEAVTHIEGVDIGDAG